MTEHTIGIDISKTHLDAFRLEDQAARQFENAPRGFRALIRWLGQTPVARIVFEPTGPYHRAFETALSSAGIGYQLRGGERFFSRREVRDGILQLRAAARAAQDLTGDDVPDRVRDVLASLGYSA